MLHRVQRLQIAVAYCPQVEGCKAAVCEPKASDLYTHMLTRPLVSLKYAVYYLEIVDIDPLSSV